MTSNGFTSWLVSRSLVIPPPSARFHSSTLVLTTPTLSTVDMGVHHERLEGPAYEEILDEFMEAVFSRWPNVIVQVRVAFESLFE